MRELPEAERKIDLRLRRLVEAVEARAFGEREHSFSAPPGVPSGCIPAFLEIGVIYTGDDAAVDRVGFQSLSRSAGPDQSIAVGSIPPSRLVELAALPSVLSIHGNDPMHFELDDSLGIIGVSAIRDVDPAATGDGVVIAIIDSGIDWKHGTFRAPSGLTRIIAIWDLALAPIAGEEPGPIRQTPAGPRPLGTRYSRDDIDFSLDSGVPTLPPPRPPVKVRHRDETPKSTSPQSIEAAHGTHVAGIAAGNGLAPHCCHPSGGKYVGVAPDASLLIVKTLQMDGDHAVNFVAAIDWIETHPEVVGLPIVLNISAGTDLGAHDGTHLIEQRLEAFMNTAPGAPTRVVVKSAGNEATTRRHIQAQVPALGEISIPLEVIEGTNQTAQLDFWYAAGALDFEVVVGSHTTGRLLQATVPLPQLTNHVVNPGADPDEESWLSLAWTLAAPGNGQRNVAMTIMQPNDRNETGPIVTGPWTIKVHNPGAGPVTLDGWIEKGSTGIRFYGSGSGPSGVKATSLGTLTIPGTAPNVISVANHDKPSCSGCSDSEELHKTSSQGPSRRTTGPSKPTLAAPGTTIASAEANYSSWLPKCCESPWVAPPGGTSMAAPHVAGTVALMLQKNRTLTVQQIHTLLTDNARGGNGGNPHRWGAGKLDAHAAWLATPAPPPPPPPPGGRMASPAPVRVLAGEVDGGTMAGAVTVGVIAPAVRVAPAAVGHPLRALARARVRQPDETALAASLVSRHWSEVRGLMARNRKVATLWHRADGPFLLRRLGLGMTDASAVAPIRSAADRSYLLRLFALLERYGSPRLAANVRAYGARVLEILAVPLAAPAEGQAVAQAAADPTMQRVAAPVAPSTEGDS